VPEAETNISWLPFDPRDWEQLTPAFGLLRSMVGAHGPKLIVNNRAAAFFDRCVHKGRLELALVAPDLTSYRLFDEAERRKLTIRVPLNYEEGCSIEPYYKGHWYARRSNLEELTAIPVTPVARAETERVPAKTPPAGPASAPPTESPRVEPVAELASVASTELLGALNPSASPVEPPRRSREKKRSRKKTTHQGAQWQTTKRVRRQGPDRFGESDRALFPEMTKLMKDEQLSVEEAAGRLGALGKIKGRGNADSRKHRLAKRYRDERGEPKTP